MLLFPFRVDPSLEASKNNFERVTSPEIVTIHLKTCNRKLPPYKCFEYIIKSHPRSTIPAGKQKYFKSLYRGLQNVEVRDSHIIHCYDNKNYRGKTEPASETAR